MSINLDEFKIMGRVAGRHDMRLDGMADLLVRARGMSVMDIGCNRGMAGADFARQGARLIHGCDIAKEAIYVARALFSDMRYVESRFEEVDLTKGPAALGVFGSQRYDIVLMLATYHKLKRVMPKEALSELCRYLGACTDKYFAWRGTSEKHEENEQEMGNLDRDMEREGLKRLHTSRLSLELGLAAIWGRRP